MLIKNQTNIKEIEHIKRCPACHAKWMVFKQTGRFFTDEMISLENLRAVQRMCNEVRKEEKKNDS